MTRAGLLFLLAGLACTKDRDPPPTATPEARPMDMDPLTRAAALDAQARTATDRISAERALLVALVLRRANLPAGDPRIVASLGALAEHYTQQGHWDEMSVMRGQMLALVPPGPGPAPGGPFPRVGLPNYDSEAMRPRTLLSRWLNRRVLPELYQSPEVSPDACEAQRRDAATRAPADTPDAAVALARLGAILAAQARLAEALAAYGQALARHPETAAIQAEIDVLQDLLDTGAQ
jgi:hypothetical protein